MRLHIVQRAADSFVEGILLQDQVVCRSDQDVSVGILRVDMICRPADTRCRIAAHRLQEDLPWGQLGELLQHKVSVDSVGDDDKVLLRDYLREAIISHLKKGATCGEDIEELLRLGLTAIWPKAAAYASAHDDTIVVCVHSLFYYRG